MHNIPECSAKKSGTSRLVKHLGLVDMVPKYHRWPNVPPSGTCFDKESPHYSQLLYTSIEKRNESRNLVCFYMHFPLFLSLSISRVRDHAVSTTVTTDSESRTFETQNQNPLANWLKTTLQRKYFDLDILK